MDNKKVCETCKYLRNAFWYEWCMKYEATCENVKRYKENKMNCWEENNYGENQKIQKRYEYDTKTI